MKILNPNLQLARRARKDSSKVRASLEYACCSDWIRRPMGPATEGRLRWLVQGEAGA